jgi:hypothetical protein
LAGHLFNISRKFLALLVLVFISGNINAFNNDSILINRLLQRIDYLQIKENGIFPKGSIPSYRIYALNKTRYKADINPFFTGLVSFTLKDLLPNLSPSQQQKAKGIIERGQFVYPKFKSKKYPERNTYNFWPTDTLQIFPNGGWLNLFNKQQSLPDDLDDTVIILLAQNAEDSIANQVHDLMQLYRNGFEKNISNTYEEYKKIGAYSTWFGKKMPVDFEIGVLANVLYFVQYYQLPWSGADSASLKLIVKIIEDKKFIHSANYISPHYVKPSVILYHISRLMALKPIPELEMLKPILVAETNKLMLSEKLFMDQVLLSTSLLRWGVLPPKITIQNASSLEALVEDDNFYFFIANIASMLSNPFKQTVGDIGVGKFYYHSPGYNNLLLLENLVLHQTQGK